MRRQPPRSTRTDTSCPTRRSTDLALASPRYTRFLLRLGGWLEDRGWRPEATREAAREMALAQPLVALADALLAKRHRPALKRGRGFAKLPPPDRTQMRIAVKQPIEPHEMLRGPVPQPRRKGDTPATAT